ncbi:hypothetical protein EJV47_00450 [Hymenobacter gummosus]|uniref:Tetratricopeptide repeat protein n=1 Tax=Hymenobacter gummosus TaxID=1776032 RepID=A0A431U8G1_9BACT|nr:tetratricopeptide repeat protein [Hymenobacter gummosus]RTQ53245.1 hypothetical protein EJV47_00450 [Hymenobacter gummosus]
MSFVRYLRLGLLFCLLPLLAPAQSNYYLRNADVPMPRRLNTVLYTNVDFDTTLVNTQVNKGQIIGRTPDQPLVRSVRYGLAIIDSEQAYEAGQFQRAAELLEEAARHEPTNPFITYQLARALYKTDATKPRAYTLYRRLVTQLDAAAPATDSTVVVDLGFVEAYWKLGTLYMDNEQWPDAIVSISRFLMGAQTLDYLHPALHEQALGYLTECFYQVQDAEKCRYFGQRVLKLYPRNEYVRPYLAGLPKPKAAAAKAKPTARKR